MHQEKHLKNNNLHHQEQKIRAEHISHPQELRVALVGKPNCGKTVLFNALTGSRQKVANYSGVTVEKKHGYFSTPQSTMITLVDLPGTYSLRSRSPDEKVTRDVVLNQFNEEDSIDVILAVVDATNLSGCLRLILELKRTGIPLVAALNMSDLAKLRGFEYDLKKLSTMLDCPIIETTATQKQGVYELAAELDKYKQLGGKNINQWQEPTREMVRDYHKRVHEIIQATETRRGLPSLWSNKIDKLLLHPVIGLVILLAILFTMFQAVFSWATIPQSWMQGIFDSAQDYVAAINPHSFVISLIANGVIAGIGAILVLDRKSSRLNSSH